MIEKNLMIIAGIWPTRSNPISGLFVCQQTQAIVRRGCRVVVLIPTSPLFDHDPLLSHEKLDLDPEMIMLRRVPFLRLPDRLSHSASAMTLNFWSCGRALKRAIERVQQYMRLDACLIHEIRPAGLALKTFRKSIKGKVGIVIHGRDPGIVRMIDSADAADVFLDAANYSDFVFPVGTPLLDYVKSIWPMNRIFVIPNGTNIPKKLNPYKTSSIKTSSATVLSVSNLVPIKGIDFNLRAFADISRHRHDLNWEYRVIGDGPERSRLMNLADELGIADKVKFLGRLSYEATMDEVEKCDIFSLPSFGEAFGIVYLEAMARGKPVIGCRNNGPEDFVIHNDDGLLVAAQSVTQLSQALLFLISNPPLRKEIGERARRKAETFTWDRNVQSLLRVLIYGEGF